MNNDTPSLIEMGKWYYGRNKKGWLVCGCATIFKGGILIAGNTLVDFPNGVRGPFDCVSHAAKAMRKDTEI